MYGRNFIFSKEETAFGMQVRKGSYAKRARSLCVP
jgi:hypothetical protein